MEPGMPIVTSDGRLIGYVGPRSRKGNIHLALSPHIVPLGWIARVNRDVILRKTYQQVTEAWGAEPGPIVIAGGKSTA